MMGVRLGVGTGSPLPNIRPGPEQPRCKQQELTVKNSDQPTQQWFLRLQSAYVLPLARGVYLLIAVVCLLTVIGGVLYAVYLQASTASQPTMVAVPPPYQGGAAVTQPSAREMNLAVVGSRLVSPTNIRFVLVAGTIATPPRRRGCPRALRRRHPEQACVIPKRREYPRRTGRRPLRADRRRCTPRDRSCRTARTRDADQRCVARQQGGYEPHLRDSRCGQG